MSNTAEVETQPEGVPTHVNRGQEAKPQFLNSQEYIAGSEKTSAMVDDTFNSPPIEPDHFDGNLMRADEQAKAEPHKYLYSGAVLFVLGFYFVYIFLCKWRKDRKNKKPIKNELVEEKVDNDQTPESSKPSKEVEMIELS